ncbi:hypothetical protein EB118_19695 [bacterium]|nr:hypothetical protein [Synechococcaceae bacterium WB6_1A_059]NDG32286.1 hypothetical protein [bacterium]NDG79912.1 hypothetical protein [Synechococcaceae bacterium WB8_1B_057]
MYYFDKTLPINPNNTENVQISSHFFWKNCADQSVINDFIRIGESLPEQDASIGEESSSSVNFRTRLSKLSWIHRNEDNKSLFEFLIDKIDRINYWHYGFNLTGLEALQYTRYPLNGHYDFHNDILMNKTKYCRKLSIVLSLSSLDEYQGGEFNLMPNGINPTQFRFDKGDLIAFPGWVPHKVDPITKGTRITIVSWANGPKFI